MCVYVYGDVYWNEGDKGKCNKEEKKNGLQ